jgi:hypothetical protein
MRYLSNAGIITLLPSLAAKDPKTRQLKYEDVSDMRFVAELEREELFKRVSGK